MSSAALIREARAFPLEHADCKVSECLLLGRMTDALEAAESSLTAVRALPEKWRAEGYFRGSSSMRAAQADIAALAAKPPAATNPPEQA